MLPTLQTRTSSNCSSTNSLHYLILVENGRKRKHKEAAAAKKIEKATKADQKYSHGYAVLESSGGGVKRNRIVASDDDSENDSDDGSMC